MIFLFSQIKFIKSFRKFKTGSRISLLFPILRSSSHKINVLLISNPNNAYRKLPLLSSHTDRIGHIQLILDVVCSTNTWFIQRHSNTFPLMSYSWTSYKAGMTETIENVRQRANVCVSSGASNAQLEDFFKTPWQFTNILNGIFTSICIHKNEVRISFGSFTFCKCFEWVMQAGMRYEIILRYVLPLCRFLASLLSVVCMYACIM